MRPAPVADPVRRPTLALSALLALAACVPGAVTRPAAAGAGAAGAYDVVIENGRIVDGTGAAWFHGDVGVVGDRLTRIAPAGALRAATARRRIDARGLVVAPGFIDIHSGSYGSFTGAGDGRSVSKITQGITTEIMGEGGTPAPLNPARGRTGGFALGSRGADSSAAFTGARGFGGWLDAMARHGSSPNVGSFVGGATVRIYAKGEAQGAPTPAELDTMRAVTRRAMEDGAFGIGTALIYPPGNYATTAELVEMAKAMAPYGGIYITHMRSEGDQLLEAMDEAIRIGREGGVPVEIWHLKAAGQRNWPKAAQAIAKIDSARRAGLDVQADMYPYTAGGTGLSACTPPWAAEDGKLIENLQNAQTRARIRAEMLSDQTAWENLCQLATPENVLLLGLRQPQHAPLVGKRLAEAARTLGKEWPDVVIDLLVAERQRIGTIYFLMSEDNVRLQLRQPWMKFGTDAGGIDPDSARGTLTHPRAYGSFPRIMGRYVRDEQVISLEDAVRKATSAVATRLQIAQRGILREGFYADLVLFDPATIAERATYENPHQLSTGVAWVLVNGVPVVAEGRPTGATPGRVLRGRGWRQTMSAASTSGS
jgi:dihydroorotase/N-acyl-D-amino-acid deacylase